MATDDRRHRGAARRKSVLADEGLRRLIGLAIVCGAVVGLERYGPCAPPDYPSGVSLPDDPEQTPAEREPWERPPYRFEPLAAYSLEAMVVRTKRYRRGLEHELAEVDVGLVWGPMADDALLEDARWSQRNRFLHWRSDNPAVLANERYIANVHLIPSTPDVARAIRRLDPGDIVSIDGALVSVTGPDGFRWRSSTSRDDRRYGACEVIWVDAIRVRNPGGD